MKLSELKPCCSSPTQIVQEARVKLSFPIITPFWNYRIVCDNCGKATPWFDSLTKAYEWWDKEGGIK